MVRPRRTLALCALAVAGTIAVPGAASAATAASGTFSGRIAGALPTAGRGEASVRAYDAASGVLANVAIATRSGAFTLRLPAGAYLVVATSIRDRAVMREAFVPVSLRAGQRRKGVTLHLGAVTAKPTSKTPSPARATGVAASAGITAYRFDQLAGATASLAKLGRSLPSLVATDVTGDESCPAAQLASPRERAVLSNTGRLKRSPYFASSTPLTRRLLAPQLAVTGTVTAGKDRAHAAFTLRLVDLATGTTVDTFKGAVRRSGRGLFTDERRLAAALSERICRRPRNYRVGLAIDARGEYAAYNSTSHLASATTARATTPEPYSTWMGGATFTWTDNVFRSRVTGCPASNIKPGTGGWSASVTALAGAQVRVDLDLSLSEYTANSKADFICTGGIASITGAPGPLLTGTAPRTFTLPATGGTGKISSTTTLALGTGLMQSGTVTLTPVWSHALPGA